MKGKNKLVPRLLGVNKDSVVRVDLQTKEVCILSFKSIYDNHSVYVVLHNGTE